MKIGDRVRLSISVKGPHDRVGKIIRICGDLAEVKWRNGITKRHHHHSLIKINEPFPYRSHRTMAQVDADEQKPVPA